MEPVSNVVKINGTDYSEDDLSDKQKYIINQIRDLQGKENNIQFQLDQIKAAREVFVSSLIQSVEEKEESLNKKQGLLL
jgi:hypothetical protein